MKERLSEFADTKNVQLTLVGSLVSQTVYIITKGGSKTESVLNNNLR